MAIIENERKRNTLQGQVQRMEQVAGPMPPYPSVATAAPAAAAPAPVASSPSPTLQQQVNGMQQVTGPMPPWPPSVAAPAPVVPTPPPAMPLGARSPRTANDAAAAYLNPPAVAPAAPAGSTSTLVMPGGAPAAPSQASLDIQDAYRQGAQTSTATGVGMALREGVISPASRAMGAVADGVSNAPRLQILRENLSDVGEGVRAFITGRPPSVAAPAAAPVAARPAPAAAARAPATIDAATGQVVPAAAPAPQPGLQTTRDANGNVVITGPQPATGNLQVSQEGNQRTITGDRPPPGPPSSVRYVARPQVTPEIGAPSVRARSAIGGLFGSSVALSGIRGQEARRQLGVKNQRADAKLDLEAQKFGVDAAKANADIARSGEETKKIKAENERAAQVSALEQQILAEKNPQKRRELENRLTVLKGKRPGNYQVVSVKTVDPVGMPIETPYIIDADTGQARPVVGGGQAQAAPTVEAARAAVAAGADRAKVNERLKAAGLPTI